MIEIQGYNSSIKFDNECYILNNIDFGTAGSTMSTTRGLRQHGSFYNYSILGSRTILLTVTLFNNGESIDKLRQNVINTLNPLDSLILHIDDKYSIDCILSGTIQFNSKIKYNNDYYTELLIELFCPSPTFKEKNVQVEGSTLWDNKFEFPFSFEEEFEFAIKNESLTMNIYNDSPFEIGMQIELEFKSDVVNPMILNINTREYIQLNGTFTNGEKVIITTYFGNKRIESSIKGNIMQMVDYSSTFMQLKRGLNTFVLEAEENKQYIECYIKYRNEHLDI